MSSLSAFLSGQRGRAAQMARETCIAPAFLSQISRGERPAPAEWCAAIERASGLAVRRWDLRADDWHRIWPELIGTPGAPGISADEGEAVVACHR